MSNITVTKEFIDFAFHMEVEVEPFVPGKFSGPPENCYPDEGGEVTVNTITMTVPTGAKIELTDQIISELGIDPMVFQNWADDLVAQRDVDKSDPDEDPPETNFE